MLSANISNRLSSWTWSPPRDGWHPEIASSVTGIQSGWLRQARSKAGACHWCIERDPDALEDPLAKEVTFDRHRSGTMPWASCKCQPGLRLECTREHALLCLNHWA